MRINRRAFVRSALVAVPAVALSTVAASPPLIHTPAAPSDGDPQAIASNWILGGTIKNHTATLTFGGSIASFGNDAYSALGLDSAPRDITGVITDLTLTMNDLRRYSGARVMHPIRPRTANGHLDITAALMFPNVRITDPATLPGTVKNLRYPRWIQATLTMRFDTTDASAPLTVSRDMNAEPTALVTKGNTTSINYWGTSTDLS